LIPPRLMPLGSPALQLCFLFVFVAGRPNVGRKVRRIPTDGTSCPRDPTGGRLCGRWGRGGRSPCPGSSQIPVFLRQPLPPPNRAPSWTSMVAHFFCALSGGLRFRQWSNFFWLVSMHIIRAVDFYLDRFFSGVRRWTSIWEWMKQGHWNLIRGGETSQNVG